MGNIFARGVTVWDHESFLGIRGGVRHLPKGMHAPKRSFQVEKGLYRANSREEQNKDGSKVFRDVPEGPQRQNKLFCES